MQDVPSVSVSGLVWDYPGNSIVPKSNLRSIDSRSVAGGLLVCVAVLLSSVALAAPVKVAFVGDQGVGEHAQAVLSLIASEGTDLLLIQGDLGYNDNTAALWETNLDNALGADFPVLTVVGNHENHEWPIYQNLIQKRIDRVDSLSCTGEAGVKAACQFANIDIVQVAPGIREVEGVSPDADYAQFISSSFSDSGDRWRICSWHKNQEALQTGAKSNSTGWAVYDACLNAGAMIALAHEHAYSRTHLLSDFENQTIVHKSNDMTLQPGQSFAFVSGLGGWQVRPQLRGGDWWASIYTATQGATHGALFCSFEDKTADCYFKAIDGAVPDQFSLSLATSSVTESASEIVDNLAVEPVQESAVSTADNTRFLPAPVPAQESAPERDPPMETALASINSNSVFSTSENDSALAAAQPLHEMRVSGGSISWWLLSIFVIVFRLRKGMLTCLCKTGYK